MSMHVESTTNSGTPPRAGRREWIGLAVITLPCLLYSMDLTVLHLAVPHLSADLKPTSTQLLWIVDIYGFLVAGSLITMGTLGDRIGRRKLLLIGAAAFGVASVIAAYSTTPTMLIATRALLGFAGATLAPSTLSLIRNMFHDPHQRMAAIGVWGTGYAAGGAIGPLVGGVLLEYFWWGSVFLIAVPVMLLLLAVGPVLLPEYRDPKAGRLDFLSAGMSLAAVLPIIYGLKKLAESGPNITAALFIAAGLIVAALFVRRQRNLVGTPQGPMLDLRLFSNRAFSAALLTNMLGVFVAFGGFLYIAQYMQLVLGLSPLQAGLWSLPGSAMVIVMSNLGPQIVRRLHPAVVIGGGLLLTAFGYGLLTQVGGPSSLALLVIGNVVMSAGFGPIFVLTSDLIVGSAPPERAGAASAMSETSSEFGGAFGIAVLGSIGTAVYRRMMATATLNGVPAEAAESARDTLGGAVAVSANLPADVAADLLGLARAAFTDGMQLTFVFATLVTAATAILIPILLRNARAASYAEEAEPEMVPAASSIGIE